MIKIKWVNPSDFVDESKFKSDSDYKEIHVNTSYYILKSYYKFKRPEAYNDIIWDEPIFTPILDVYTLADKIVSDKIDILCLSFFVWNISTLQLLAKIVKQKNPNILIIAGGPTLDAHKRTEFFDEKPFLDFVIYGDGEEPFVDIIDAYMASAPLSTNAKNIVTKDRKYPFKIFSDKEFWNFSPILDLKDNISNDIMKIKDMGYAIKFHWEIDRGCPYACSFCDWSSGLHHKVKRRTKFWKEELNFISSLPVLIRTTSANHGIFKEDIEISQYAAENKLNFKPLYMAKLNKDRVWEINRIHAKYDPNYVVSISVQDLDKNILGNIDRPDIDWEDHKKYILDFKAEYPDTYMYFETMIGLPGQTIETYKFMLKELDDIGVGFVTGYMWHLLPNTPAYSSDYREKYNISFGDIWQVTDSSDDRIGKHITKEQLTKLYENNSPGLYKVDMIRSTYSASWEDIVKMDILVAVYNGMKTYYPNISIETLFNSNTFNIRLHNETLKITESFAKNNIYGIWDGTSWPTPDVYYKRKDIISEFF